MPSLLNICVVIPVLLLSQIITVLDTDKKIVALTFDACETRTAAYFDESILKYLLKKQDSCDTVSQREVY